MRKTFRKNLTELTPRALLVLQPMKFHLHRHMLQPSSEYKSAHNCRMPVLSWMPVFPERAFLVKLYYKNGIAADALKEFRLRKKSQCGLLTPLALKRMVTRFKEAKYRVKPCRECKPITAQVVELKMLPQLLWNSPWIILLAPVVYVWYPGDRMYPMAQRGRLEGTEKGGALLSK